MKLAEPAQSVLPKLWGLAALNSVEHPASQLELLQNILAPQRVRMCNARYGHAMAPSTRQQHGSVGRENMPITGLPWQQIMLVTKICRMGNRWQEHVGMMSGCFRASFRAAPSAMHDNQMHRQVMMRRAGQIRSGCTVGCPTVSLFLLVNLFKTNQAFSMQCQQDLWMTTSKCLGVWACTHGWLCVCVCVFVLVYMLRAEFWLWTLLKRRQASLILSMDRRRNTIRS